MVWYDADRIERTVTRQFVCSHLLPEETARLDRPLAFGDGLTDGTYWEWIDEKAKKIFLILVDLNVPDQIFGVIDDSWDDEDLPIALEHVERLALTPNRDARFDRKFHQRQYYYLLKPLERSDHVVVYEDMEVVPLDLVDSSGGDNGSISPGGGGGGVLTGSSITGGGLGGSSSSGSSGSGSYAGGGDRVALPHYPGMVFSRRRIPLAPIAGSAYGTGSVTLEEFQYEISSIKLVQNDHLVSYFTSYVHQGYGYVLFTPAAEGSLKSFLATTPAPIKALAKRDRRRLLFNWIHCLVDTLCFVHNRGLSHGNIKPSTVLFNHYNNNNHIFFSDFTHFGTDSGGGSGHDKASFDKESYDYAAPEQWYRPSGSSGGVGGGGGGIGVGSIGSISRKGTLTGEGGSGGRGAGMSMYAGSIYGRSSSRHRHESGAGAGAGAGSEMVGLGLTIPQGEHMTTASGFAFQVGASPHFSISRSNTMGGGYGGSGSGSGSGGYGAAIPQLNPQAADVFSLGCIILELLTFMLKRPTKAFAAHRAAKHKTPGRGGAVLDSSFHKNLGQVESWMAGLARDAASSLGKKRSSKTSDDNDTTLAGVAPMLHVVERMLALHASERPSAYDVQTRMYQILRDHCGISEPHCVHEYGGFNMGWTDFAGYGAPGVTSNSSSYYSYGGTAASIGGGGGGGFGGGGGGGGSSVGGTYGSSSYGNSYSHSPRLIMTNGTTTTANSSRAVSPTTTMAMSPTSPSLMGGYSWSSNNSGAVSPTTGLSRNGSFNFGQRSMGGRRPAVHYPQQQHKRNDSGSGGSARSSIVGGGSGGGGGGGVGAGASGGANVIPEEESEGGSIMSGKDSIKDDSSFDMSDGLEVIRNLQIRDKARQSWTSPVYAAY
ncbi:MAG: hypothetical protein STHCBS139747_000297 [Sporothrix thermara]